MPMQKQLTQPMTRSLKDSFGKHASKADFSDDVTPGIPAIAAMSLAFAARSRAGCMAFVTRDMTVTCCNLAEPLLPESLPPPPEMDPGRYSRSVDGMSVV